MYSENEADDFLSDFGDLGLSIEIENTDLYADYLNNVNKKSKNNYDDAWKLYLDKITAFCRTEGCDLLDILGRVDTPGTLDNHLLIDEVARQINYDLCDFADAPENKKLITLDGRYALVDKNTLLPKVAELLAPHVGPDTQAVVELGGGWGKNLAYLFDMLGRRDIVYFNCEPSPHGRAAFEVLFKYIGGVEHHSREFHFEIPNMDFLGRFSNVLVFTVASVEQVPFLPRDFVDRVLSAAETVTFTLFEPIGWQQFSNITRFVLLRFLQESSGQVPVEEYHLFRHMFRFTDEDFHDNAASWALSCRYNMNLLRLVKRAVAEGHGKLIDVQYDLFSENPINPYSLIVMTNA